MTAVRVVVADDHPIFRDGLRALLSAEPTTELVGEASAGTEALGLVASARPDVVLMDLNMPEMGGVEATRQITAAHPEVGMLVLTMLEDDESVLAAIRAGARGYLLEGVDGEQTLRSIHAVAAGQSVFGDGAAQRVAAFLSHPVPPAPLPQLTDRERDVLVLMAKGYTNTIIAERLYLSHKTVRNYVSAIFTKLGVADRTQAVLRARDAGLT